MIAISNTIVYCISAMLMPAEGSRRPVGHTMDHGKAIRFNPGEPEAIGTAPTATGRSAGERGRSVGRTGWQVLYDFVHHPAEGQGLQPDPTRPSKGGQEQSLATK